jgi:cytidylate kinase
LTGKRLCAQTQKLDSLAKNDINAIIEGNLKPQIIAIDGPVAVGKSSVGSLLAKRLGYVFFDTGMMYRAFTCKVLKSDISTEDEQKLCQLANATKFDFIPLQGCYLSPFIDDEDVSSMLFCPEVEAHVPLVAKIAGIRQVMIQEQRGLAQRRKIVMAGRDIGTVVLPWAELKIFLTASTEERARRRYKELLERGENSSLEAVLTDLRKRDEMDITEPSPRSNPLRMP